MLTISTPLLAAIIFKGNEIVEINAIGAGNIKIRNINGKAMILVTCDPNRKRVRPIIRKKREKPDME
jgi:sortase (surface protein transpeptidase)